MTRFFRWIGKGGALHMLCCFAIVTAVAHLADAGIAVFVALLAALFKEIVVDKWFFKGPMQWHDIACDVLGVALGVIVVLIGGAV